MGASQSSADKGAAGAEKEVKTSYYNLLGVDRQAGVDEIKKAYRRKALELHPDRNLGNEAEATRTFAEVGAAYEVLSDPQERAWYDSHESATLRGDDGREEDEEVYEYRNIKLTTSDDLARILRKWNKNVKLSDSPTGFFGFLRETFEQLGQEEEVAAAWENSVPPEYPTFGHKDDSYDDVVKRFYASWSSFATVKTFAWRDKYKLSDATHRREKKYMVKENEASRRQGVREFNETVRSFVAFVRKRDPRCAGSEQSEVDRQNTLREAAAAQAARARAANQAKFEQEVPEWTKVRDPEELEESEEETQVQQVLECVVCNKTFKSEKSFQSHESSKTHLRKVKDLQRKMSKENKNLDLDGAEVGTQTPGSPQIESQSADNDEAAANSMDESAHETIEADGREKSASQTSGDEDADAAKEGTAEPTKAAQNDKSEESGSEDSDYASPETIQARMQRVSLDTPSSDDEKSPPQPAVPKQARQGKAAQKRAKKAAAAASISKEASSNAHKCVVCQEDFSSKTQLHIHIKQEGHATLTSAAPGEGSGPGKGKRAKGKKR